MRDTKSILLESAARDALQDLSMVFHRSDLESAFLRRFGIPLTAGEDQLRGWGARHIQADLYCDRNRLPADFRIRFSEESSCLIRHAKQILANTHSPVQLGIVSEEIAMSGRYGLFSARAIRSIVSIVAEKRGTVLQEQIGPASENFQVANNMAAGKIMTPEALLLKWRGIKSRLEIEALLSQEEGRNGSALQFDRRYLLEPAPGLWVHRFHIDETFRRNVKQAKATLLALLPRRIARSGETSLCVERLGREFIRNHAFQLFSLGALFVLICQFGRQNPGYMLQGDDSTPWKCCISKRVIRDTGYRNCESGSGISKEQGSANNPISIPKEDFCPEDIVYSTDKSEALASQRRHFRWREDFSRGTVDPEEIVAIETVNGASEKSLAGNKINHVDAAPDLISKAEKEDVNHPTGHSYSNTESDTEVESSADRKRAFNDFKRHEARYHEVDENGKLVSTSQDAMLEEDSEQSEENDSQISLTRSSPQGEEELDDDIEDAAEIYDTMAQFTSDADDFSIEDYESEYIEELDEYDEDAVYDSEDKIQTDGRISRELRAKQVAIEVALKFDWNPDGIELLRDLFFRYGWSATRQSIERALEEEITPDELRLAVGVREIWEDGGYSDSCIGFSSRRQFSAYDRLSWPMALVLVRRFGGLPDLNEIEAYISQRFEEWLERRSIHSQFPIFADYLCSCIQDSPEESEISDPWSLSGKFFESEEDDSTDRGESILRKYLKDL